MEKNGRTGKGTQRWRCRACRLSSTMPQRGRRRARTLEEFLSWLPGPSSQTASESTGDARALRKRIAWCWSIRPRIAPAGREAPHGHGRRHVHGPRLRLIIAIDGESEEVLALQWCAHEELRRCCRRLEKLFREGKLFAFLEPALATGGPVARTTNRLEGGVNSVVKNVLRNHRGLPEEHMLRACEWVCYMKTAHPRRNRSFPTIRWRTGKRRRPNRKATSRPHTGSASTGTNSTPARDIPTAPTDAENQT